MGLKAKALYLPSKALTELRQFYISLYNSYIDIYRERYTDMIHIK